jgi:hypothetical protein
MAATPPPGRPRSLIAEADRERLVARLREHYARGELELDDLSRRVEVVLSATCLDEAAAGVADLRPASGSAIRQQGDHASLGGPVHRPRDPLLPSRW